MSILFLIWIILEKFYSVLFEPNECLDFCLLALIIRPTGTSQVRVLTRRFCGLFPDFQNTQKFHESIYAMHLLTHMNLGGFGQLTLAFFTITSPCHIRLIISRKWIKDTRRSMPTNHGGVCLSKFSLLLLLLITAYPPGLSETTLLLLYMVISRSVPQPDVFLMPMQSVGASTSLTKLYFAYWCQSAF
jgi:hypothetical protein